jgi:hypothetical protein
MTDKEKIEGNRFLAQFMGLTVIENDPFIKGFNLNEHRLPTLHEELLKYHTSWNWLMPVFFRYKEVGFLDIENPNNYENYENFNRKFSLSLTYSNTLKQPFELLIKEIKNNSNIIW